MTRELTAEGWRNNGEYTWLLNKQHAVLALSPKSARQLSTRPPPRGHGSRVPRCQPGVKTPKLTSKQVVPDDGGVGITSFGQN